MPTIRETPNPRFTLLLYGMPKIGKTSTAAQFPNPLILDCEPGGTDFVVGLPIEPVRSLADVRTAIHKYGANYDTIVIDGLTWLINREVDEANRNKKDPRRGYATVVGSLRELLAYALDQNKIVVATGHHRSAVTPINPEAPNSPVRTEIRPDVSPALADDLFGLFSVILYCFASNGKSKAITKPRVTTAQDIYAGDRSGRLPEIIDLSATAILTGLGFAIAQAGKVTTPPPATEKDTTPEPPQPPPATDKEHSNGNGPIPESAHTSASKEFASIPGKSAAGVVDKMTDHQLQRIKEEAARIYGPTWADDGNEKKLAQFITKGVAEKFTSLNKDEAKGLIDALLRRANHGQPKQTA